MKNIYTCILILVMGVGLLMMGCGPPVVKPISASDGVGSTVTVDWSEWLHGTDATTFNVYSSSNIICTANPADPVCIAAGGVTQVGFSVSGTTFVDNTGTTGTVYFYQVEAEASGGDEMCLLLDAGYYGTSGPCSVTPATEDGWAAAQLSLNDDFAAAFPGAEAAPPPGNIYNHICAGLYGGTEDVTYTDEGAGITSISVAFGNCHDATTNKIVVGNAVLVFNSLGQGFAASGLGFVDVGTGIPEGAAYTDTVIDLAAVPPEFTEMNVFVTDGTWTDTEHRYTP